MSENDDKSERIDKLEQQVEQQAEHIETLESAIEEVSRPVIGRRGLLGGLGIAALGSGALVGSAAGATGDGSGQIGTAENPLDEIYADSVLQNTAFISEDGSNVFIGDDIDVDEDMDEGDYLIE